MTEERLQKILARAGVTSRRKAEELIREGRVTVNGQVATLGDKADLERDAVKLDGKRILGQRGEHRYLLLNKPRGVMSTVADPGGRPTVMEFVPPGMRKALVPVGRLDFSTEGLLLLTDDGDFAQRVSHPRYGCVKTYEAKVKGRPAEADVLRLEAGIVLDGKRTAPCRITPRPVPRRHDEGENSWWLVELSQGMTRQIREMFQRIGHPVLKLRRVAIGPVTDPHLPVGSLRELTGREVELLLRSGKKPAPKATAKKPATKPAPATARPKPATKRTSEKRLRAGGGALPPGGGGTGRGDKPAGAKRRLKGGRSSPKAPSPRPSPARGEGAPARSQRRTSQATGAKRPAPNARRPRGGRRPGGATRGR